MFVFSTAVKIAMRGGLGTRLWKHCAVKLGSTLYDKSLGVEPGKEGSTFLYLYYPPALSHTPCRNFHFKQAHALHTWYETLKEHTFPTEFITLTTAEVGCWLGDGGWGRWLGGGVAGREMGVGSLAGRWGWGRWPGDGGGVAGWEMGVGSLAVRWGWGCWL